jgi:membrane protease YdiL (CAAX protease family)
MLDYDVQQKPRLSPLSQLAVLFLLSGFGLLLGSFISIPIVTTYLHVSLTELPNALLKSENANLSRILQFITTFFFMAVPSFVFARIMDKQPFKYIGFNRAVSGKQVFIIVGIVFIGLIVSGVLGELNELIPLSKNAEKYFKDLENEYNKEMLVIANMKTVQDYLISLVVIALLPALFEEMLFRGSLQPIMISLTKNAFIGILITSIFFSAIHMSYYGFLPRLALGLMIGYVYYFSKNLWLPVATHFLYNAFGVSQMYSLSRAGMLNADAMNDTFPLYYGLIAAAALFVIFIMFKKESEVVISMYNFRHLPKETVDENTNP